MLAWSLAVEMLAFALTGTFLLAKPIAPALMRAGAIVSTAWMPLHPKESLHKFPGTTKLGCARHDGQWCRPSRWMMAWRSDLVFLRDR